jgi:hypothetical protein
VELPLNARAVNVDELLLQAASSLARRELEALRNQLAADFAPIVSLSRCMYALHHAEHCPTI